MTPVPDPDPESLLGRREAEPGQAMLTIIRSNLTIEEFLQSSQEVVERAKARSLPAPKSDFRREDIYDDEEGR